MILLLATLLSGPRSPPDTVLVDVLLTSTQQHVIVQATTADTLTLPAQQLYSLTGLGTAPSPWITLTAFRQVVGPAVTVTWWPQRLELDIEDPLNVLPASAKAVQAFRTRARDAAISNLSGGWASLAVNDSLEAAVDLGYVFAGKLVVEGLADARGHAAWSASVAPDPHLYAAVTNGGTIYGRVSLGPVWASASWQPGSVPRPAGFIRAGPANLFVSTTAALFTWQPPGGQAALQLMHAWNGGTTAALTVGVRPASAFGVPSTMVR